MDVEPGLRSESEIDPEPGSSCQLEMFSLESTAAVSNKNLKGKGGLSLKAGGLKASGRKPVNFKSVVLSSSEFLYHLPALSIVDGLYLLISL